MRPVVRASRSWARDRDDVEETACRATAFMKLTRAHEHEPAWPVRNADLGAEGRERGRRIRDVAPVRLPRLGSTSGEGGRTTPATRVAKKGARSP